MRPDLPSASSPEGKAQKPAELGHGTPGGILRPVGQKWNLAGRKVFQHTRASMWHVSNSEDTYKSRDVRSLLPAPGSDTDSARVTQKSENSWRPTQLQGLLRGAFHPRSPPRWRRARNRSPRKAPLPPPSSPLSERACFQPASWAARNFGTHSKTKLSNTTTNINKWVQRVPNTSTLQYQRGTFSRDSKHLMCIGSGVPPSPAKKPLLCTVFQYLFS